MAASVDVSCHIKLTGLGIEINLQHLFNTASTPDAQTTQRRTLATADTAEALALGDVSTTELLYIRAVTNDLDVDLDFVSSFDADFTLNAGEFAIVPTPAGTVYVKNSDAGETPVYEYCIIGTT